VRVVIAGDGLIVREGIAGMLRRFGHEVVAAVGDAPALRAAVAAYRPDVVVTDVRMPPGFSDEGCGPRSPCAPPTRTCRCWC
jgi:DNA-binding NarL/FixJ family response regulator